MDGFLNLNKPAGFTSHDCVAKVRRILKTKRVGHAGTLDPAAIGVLPIAIGRATRLLQYLPDGKAYRATVRLGVQTTTDDLEGEVLATHPAPTLTLSAVEPILSAFQGVIQQVPPSYSAIQVQGQRLYDLARSGQVATAPVRTVEVFQITVLDWRSGEFPELDLDIACGPGTYIRAIARDLGTQLGIGGTLAALLRTHSSGFDLDHSISLEALETHAQTNTVPLVSPDLALGHLDTIALPTAQAKRWCQGQRIGISQPKPSPNIYRVQHEDGRFLGIGILAEDESGSEFKDESNCELESEFELENKLNKKELDRKPEGVCLVPKLVFGDFQF